MIKAIAILTTGDKTEILATGRTGECRKAAVEAGLKIKSVGDACVQVFSTEGLIFNDDGRKADYQRRREAAERAAQASDSDLGSKPAAKKVASKTAKKVASKTGD